MIKFLKKHKVFFSILLIVLLSLPGVSALFYPGFFTNHDGEGHIIRLQEFHNALFDGQIPVRLSERLNWGYSYPFFNFNYPLVYWVGEVFHLVGFSFVDSVKLIFIAGYIASGIFMYLWQRHWWGELGGIFAALVYLYMPYRFSNMYVRGSVAEHLAFVFVPLIFHWVGDIAQSRKWLDAVLGAFFLGFLSLSHNISALIFSGLLSLYMVWMMIVKKSFSLAKYYLVVIFGGVFLSAFFLIPAFLEKKITFLSVTIAKDYPDHFLLPHQLIVPSWGFGASVKGPLDGMSFQIGIVQIAVIVFAILYLLILTRQKFEKISSLFFFIAVIFLSIFLILDISKFLWDRLPLLPFVQFSWRFLSLVTLAIATLAGSVFFFANRFFRKIKSQKLHYLSKAVFLLILTGFLYATNFLYWRVNEQIDVVLPDGIAIEGTTTWAHEQTPIWLDEKFRKVSQDRVEVLQGSADPFNLKWSSNQHTYNIFAFTPSKIVENTAFWPGWKVFVDDIEVPIDFQSKEVGGRIAYSVTPGMHDVKVVFGETTMRLISDLVSLTALIVLGGLALFLKFRKVEK